MFNWSRSPPLLPVSYVWSPNTVTASLRCQGSGWRRQTRWSGLLVYTSRQRIGLTPPTTGITSPSPIQAKLPWPWPCSITRSHVVFQHLMSRFFFQHLNHEWKLFGFVHAVWDTVTGGDSWWSKQCALMEAMMMKLDGPDLLVPEKCDRKYFQTEFFLGAHCWRPRGQGYILACGRRI